jgi:hypothetical protein
VRQGNIQPVPRFAPPEIPEASASSSRGEVEPIHVPALAPRAAPEEPEVSAVVAAVC